MTHRERNDALKENNNVAVDRYRFAVKCLKGKKIIGDLGCGLGYGSHLLREAGHLVVGIDYSEEAINYAKSNYPGGYIVANLEKDRIPDFDNVVCLEVLCHLKKPQEFLDRLKAKVLVISAPIDPNPDDGYFYRLHNLSEVYFRDMVKRWQVINEFRQKQYLTLYCEKI